MISAVEEIYGLRCRVAELDNENFELKKDLEAYKKQLQVTKDKLSNIWWEIDKMQNSMKDRGIV